LKDFGLSHRHVVAGNLEGMALYLAMLTANALRDLIGSKTRSLQ
jgi:hypothetical protein